MRYGADDVLVEVADDGARRAGGCSACASASRSTAASSSTAPAPDGGWRVAARLPLEAAP